MNYYILMTYPGQKQVVVMHDANNQVITADNEEGRNLLVQMADKLLLRKLISNYRLVKEETI